MFLTSPGIMIWTPPSCIETTKTYRIACSSTPNAQATAREQAIQAIEGPMTSYKPVKSAPPAAKSHKRHNKTETPQMVKPMPYKKPGAKTDS